MKDTILFNLYKQHNETLKLRTILSGNFRLDKKDMIEMLSYDFVTVMDRYYKVPERQILECLMKKQFGETYLKLEEVEF